MTTNAQREPSSSTPQPSSRDADSTLLAMLLQDNKLHALLHALLQDSTFRSITELGSVPPETGPECVSPGEVENAGKQILDEDSRLETLSQNGTFRAIIDRLLSVLPPAEYAVDERALSCITVPPKPDGATLAEYPDGWSECLVTNEIKNKILSTPGFSTSLAHPPRAHRIGSAPGKGLGIFATRDLDMGDLICIERPLLVTPSCTTHVKIGHPQDWTREQLERGMAFVWGQQYYRVFERLEPEAQNAFLLSLANIHMEDGSWTAHGICRTNSFGIEELFDTIGTTKAPYARVCKEFSRANHSCGPNVTRYFDLKSFAFHFSAVRPIKAGEEMTVAYGVTSGKTSLLIYGQLAIIVHKPPIIMTF
ncbi:hypothetical protein BD779DRAFT_1677576 [Infundibulicybe gibba]|nr:hypothetical protein BD779DRAFT_1677576 [Infundibulicybe gibba]